MPYSPMDDLRDLRAVFSADVQLSAPERAVLAALLLHRNGQTGRTDPSITTIAGETGYCRRTVVQTISTLEQAGRLHRDRGVGTRTRYTVHPPTSAAAALVQEMHQCSTCTGVVQEMHRTSAADAPERTKNERSNERSAISEIWEAYQADMEGARLQLTPGRKRALERLKHEQLDKHEDPLALFRGILAAVRATEFYMREGSSPYRLPESLFRNAERRERWALEGADRLNGRTNGNGSTSHDPLMMTTAELRR